MGLRRRPAAVFAVALIAVAVAAAAAGGRVSGAPPALEGVPRLGHVFLIMGENQGLNAITRSRSPFLTRALKPRSAFLTSYTGVTLGGSLANYLGIVAGRFTRCDLADDLPSSRCSHPWDSLFGQLESRGASWREWAESADSACDIFDTAAPGRATSTPRITSRRSISPPPRTRVRRGPDTDPALPDRHAGDGNDRAQ